MRIPKRYGQSRIEKCPFCGKQATTESKEKVPVCTNHKESILNEMKCMCGEILDLKAGKWGVYFSCMNCGNINGKKVFETNEVKDKKNEKKTSSKPKRETFREMRKRRNVFEQPETVTPNDPRYFD